MSPDLAPHSRDAFNFRAMQFSTWSGLNFLKQQGSCSCSWQSVSPPIKKPGVDINVAQWLTLHFKTVRLPFQAVCFSRTALLRGWLNHVLPSSQLDPWRLIRIFSPFPGTTLAFIFAMIVYCKLCCCVKPQHFSLGAQGIFPDKWNSIVSVRHTLYFPIRQHTFISQKEFWSVWPWVLEESLLNWNQITSICVLWRTWSKKNFKRASKVLHAFSRGLAFTRGNFSQRKAHLWDRQKCHVRLQDKM